MTTYPSEEEALIVSTEKNMVTSNAKRNYDRYFSQFSDDDNKRTPAWTSLSADDKRLWDYDSST